MAYNFAYRIGGSGTGISQSDQDNNMHAVYDRMSGYGFSLQAVCGMLGCFHEESGMNPGIYETSYGGNLNNLPYFPGGMGLAQWTDYPAYQSEYPNPLPWSAQREGRDWWDGDFQCWLVNQGNDAVYTAMGYGERPRWGWQTSPSYATDNMTWDGYKQFTGSLVAATRSWFFCFEWHGTEQNAYDQLGPNCITDRIAWANYAYDLLRGYTPDPPGPGPGPGPGPLPESSKRFFMMLKPRYKYNQNKKRRF